VYLKEKKIVQAQAIFLLLNTVSKFRHNGADNRFFIPYRPSKNHPDSAYIYIKGI
jgi:hypothetical protein